MKRFLLQFVLSLLLIPPIIARGQTDNVLGGSVSNYYTLGRSLSWGGIGFGTIGQNFIFTPVNPDEGFCVFVQNNNPSSSHTYTLTVAQTGDPGNKQYAGNTGQWTTVPFQGVFPVTVNASSTIGQNYATTASANVVVSFTGNTTQAGSPDTANVFVVQTTKSSCGGLPATDVQGVFATGTSILGTIFPVIIGGQEFNGQGSATFPLIQDGNSHALVPAAIASSYASGTPISTASVAVAEGAVNASSAGTFLYANSVPVWGFPHTSNGGSAGFIPGWAGNTSRFQAGNDLFQFGSSAAMSFFVIGTVNGPGVSATILHLKTTSTNNIPNVSFHNITLSCPAACELRLFRTTSAGTTCTALTPHSANITVTANRNTGNANVTAENACTTGPSQTDILYDINLAAGIPYTLDLQGYHLSANSTSTVIGLAVINVAAVAGQVTATLNYTEN